jgi:hypothetical protein
MEAAGIEPAPLSAEGLVYEAVTQSASETLAQTLACETQLDADLARLVDAWPTLPDALRAGIVAMARAFGKEQ